MRSDITERYYRVLTRQSVDRLPDLEFGYWPQTIRRWLGEGMPLNLTDDEKKQMFSEKVDDFFCFERHGHSLGLRTHMNPRYEETVIERRGDVTVMRDTAGIVAERYLHDVEESSIPRFIRFPVVDRQSWLDMRRRFRIDDPTRIFSDAAIREAREAAAAGKMVSVSFTGFYGQLRNWMGMESLSLALYDQPALVEEMVEHWAELCARQVERLPADLPIDYVSWWEDMAGRNGPLVSPAHFRRFLQPGYRRVMTEVRKHGCVLAHVDCDGNPHDIVANWLEEGVNVMFPLEVQAGVDPASWRREFGAELLLRGGIAKEPLVRGGSAIDRELERIKPLIEQGGFVPHLDHLVPPDIPYGHYLDYLEKKRKLIGRT